MSGIAPRSVTARRRSRGRGDADRRRARPRRRTRRLSSRSCRPVTWATDPGAPGAVEAHDVEFAAIVDRDDEVASGRIATFSRKWPTGQVATTRLGTGTRSASRCEAGADVIGTPGTRAGFSGGGTTASFTFRRCTIRAWPGPDVSSRLEPCRMTCRRSTRNPSGPWSIDRSWPEPTTIPLRASCRWRLVRRGSSAARIDLGNAAPPGPHPSR